MTSITRTSIQALGDWARRKTGPDTWIHLKPVPAEPGKATEVILTNCVRGYLLLNFWLGIYTFALFMALPAVIGRGILTDGQTVQVCGTCGHGNIVKGRGSCEQCGTSIRR